MKLSEGFDIDAVIFGMAYLRGPKSKLSFGGDGSEYEITPRAEAAIQWLVASGFAKECKPDCQTPNRRSYAGAGDIGVLAKAYDIDLFSRDHDWPTFVKKATT